ncbi:MAG: riboflavin synthase [Actinomycetota bacterium]|nr:riboflavin synthase [Actinomycetota bacterium]
MFTGIVEELGRLQSSTRTGATTRLRFAADVVTAQMSVGDSVAVNGCCLTVVAHDRCSFAVDAIDETLARTNLGQLEPDDGVNLERPLALGGRLGGHLVQGHVDGTGVVTERAPHLAVEVPAGLGRYLVEKGSITVDGCSLTLASVRPGSVRIEIIPHTARSTTLGRKGPGELVNVEVDVVAKYVEQLLRAGAPSPYVHSEGAP